MITFAPSLTWLHLLPRGARCECAGLGARERQQVERFCDGVSPRVAVCQGSACCDDHLLADALVAINGHGFSLATLAASGFRFVRRLAVLPSLENPRWFVPLDAAGISSAALSLHTPTRLSAAAKHWVARAAMWLHLPWYRDTVTVAQRSKPALEEAVERAIGGGEVRLALSAGAPEPARNRKVSLAAVSMDGRVLGFGKIGASELSRRLVLQEAKVLSSLPRSAEGRAPRLLGASQVNGFDLIVQSPLEGKPAGAEFTPAHRRFLQSLQREEQVVAAETTFVRSLVERITARKQGEDLSAAIERVMPVLAEMRVPLTVVHGDFAPWNLRQHDGEIRAFDWEYGELAGLPLIDQTHFGLQVGFQLHAWTVEQAMRWLAAMRCDELGFKAAQIRALQAVYLLDQFSRLAAEGYTDEDEMVAWYGRLLRQFAPREKVVV